LVATADGARRHRSWPSRAGGAQCNFGVAPLFGVASTRQRLRQLCDGAVTASRSYSDYAERLEAAGVELVPVTQFDGRNYRKGFWLSIQTGAY
jgi:hypothetical protein